MGNPQRLMPGSAPCVASKETKVEAEAHLRAAMDEDMGSEHTTQLRTINGRLEKVEARLEKVKGKLDLVHVGVETIQILLKGLTADVTPEDDQVSANPVDADPDALP